MEILLPGFFLQQVKRLNRYRKLVFRGPEYCNRVYRKTGIQSARKLVPNKNNIIKNNFIK